MVIVSIIILVTGLGLALFIFTIFRAATTFGMCPCCKSQVLALKMVYVGEINGRLCRRCAERVLRNHFMWANLTCR
jgi:hypothetical protein